MTSAQKAFKNSLFCFSYDLRLHDNAALCHAHANSGAVLHAVFIDEILRPIKMPGFHRPSAKRAQFLKQGIEDLAQQLAKQGQCLLIFTGYMADQLSSLIARYQFDAVFQNDSAGLDEAHAWQQNAKAYSQLHFERINSHSLYQQAQLPFGLQDLPGQFTPFRKAIEAAAKAGQCDVEPALPQPQWAKPLGLASARLNKQSLERLSYSSLGYDTQLPLEIQGGEQAVRAHLTQYFDATHASQYKQTRNALDGFSNSTKFSPWLAQGSLSAKQVYAALQTYEAEHGTNESTYWIYFELLWREFFYWRAKQDGLVLFRKRGRNSQAPLNTFYPERFKAWCEGNTAEPLVNACMKQLKQSGYMSNRGRQLVASYFIHELALDWRYGAAYFEQELLDYEVGSNWGNWQYLAGVGADPRGLRRFDIAKQARQYDPEGRFVARWQGDKQCTPLNTRDAADWPSYPGLATHD